MPSIAEMSDDDFLNLGVPAAVEQRASELEAAGNQADPDEEAARKAAEEEAAAERERLAAEEAANGNPPPEGGNVGEADKTNSQVETTAGDGSAVKQGEGTGTGGTEGDGSSITGSGAEVVETAEVVPDYKAEYEKIMAPFTANGKQIKLNNAAEVTQMMQMGANYTKKLQELAPARKALLMLQNNQLLDENSLSFLIDLKNGNKAAIQKLLKESGIDPRDIDTESDSTYQGGNHRISDSEVNLQTAVSDIRSLEGGQETFAEILKWDQASIDMVGNDPTILHHIHQHRASGVYDLVANEVERRKMLGTIPSQTSFLQAYRLVGDEMAATDRAKKEQEAAAQAAKPVQQAAPVATTVAKPKVDANAEKAKAAATSRSTTAKAEATPINPLAEADDVFMKRMAGFQGRL